MSTSSKITILGKSHRRVIVKCQLHTHILLTDDVLLTTRENITFVLPVFLMMIISCQVEILTYAY